MVSDLGPSTTGPTGADVTEASRSSEYDPIPPRPLLSAEPSDLERARVLFERSASGYLRSPWPWWVWSLLLPAAALLTRRVYPVAGPLATLVLWSVVILIGGAVEAILIFGGGERVARTPLAGWVLKTQGNLSLVAVALSGLLLWRELPEYLPAVWLLLVGHSFHGIGTLSLRPLRDAGVMLQLGGIAAMLPAADGLVVLAVSFFASCLWIGLGIHRRNRETG